MTLRNALTNILSPMLLFLVWEICSQSGVFDVRFFPPPSEIVYHLFFVSPQEGIIRDIFATLNRILWGYLAGCLAGVALGVSMGLSKPVRTFFYPVIAMIYPIPKIAILPLIMLVFGIGEMSKIVVVFIGSFFLVLLNTLHGVMNLDKIYHDVSFVYRISKPDFIFHVVLPGALPAIFTGLKLAIGYSLVIVVAAEFSGADAGIGYLIWQSWETFSIKSMYAGIFVIGALGFTFAYTLEYLERKFVSWKQ
jgi:NitT/TauT family transport system permease protein